ncbi:hypothetical protein GCM10009665_45160 [Kitasatospora nipponensis]|uniref:Uncharacterized protein n=1 Tax=Kitasatospora nipponensis TaxID=258049 RepID=A0ABN1WJZ0_9ACTN
MTTTGAAQPKRPIVDIFTKEITGFSNYKLAKAFLAWLTDHGPRTTDHGWNDLTSDEQQSWTKLFAAINKGLA